MDKKLHGAFSIPNIITYFRLLLIPAFMTAYLRGAYAWAIALLALSAVSDVADGYIARRFGMVTDIGKIVDPLADKLTQAGVLFCLAWKNPTLWILFGLLAVKELTMLAFGLAAYRRTGAHSSQWYGKLCTAALYASMAALVLFPDMPRAAVWAIIAVCGALLLLSLVLYGRYFLRAARGEDASGNALAEKERKPDESAE